MRAARGDDVQRTLLASAAPTLIAIPVLTMVLGLSIAAYGALDVDLPLLLLRTADSALAAAPSTGRIAPVLELRSSPGGRSSSAEGDRRSFAGPASEPRDGSGVTLLAAA